MILFSLSSLHLCNMWRSSSYLLSMHTRTVIGYRSLNISVFERYINRRKFANKVLQDIAAYPSQYNSYLNIMEQDILYVKGKK